MKVILISGPTGSGKTTFSNQILKKFKNGIVISTDNYYKTGLISKILSKIIENYFDRNISLNYTLLYKDLNFIINTGKCTHKYSYDFKNKTIKKSIKETANLEFLIIEGIFTENLLNNFKKNNYFLIELQKNKNSCMNRVITRDVKERGKSIDLAKRDFLKSWQFYYRKKKNISNKKRNVFICSNKRDLYLIFKNIVNLKQ